MNKSIITIIILIIGQYCLSQELIINDSILKAGFYRDFNEFKYNRPSIEFNYEIIKKTRNYNKGTVDYYRILIDKHKAKEIGFIFGFCDGNSVYILDPARDLYYKSEFMKLQYLGRYCYFEDRVPGSANNTLYLDERILDINTGEIISLNKDNITGIIADDPELLEQFNNEKKKESKIKEYIIRYLSTAN